METMVAEAPNLDKVIREDFSGMEEEKLAVLGWGGAGAWPTVREAAAACVFEVEGSQDTARL